MCRKTFLLPTLSHPSLTYSFCKYTLPSSPYGRVVNTFKQTDDKETIWHNILKEGTLHDIISITRIHVKLIAEAVSRNKQLSLAMKKTLSLQRNLYFFSRFRCKLDVFLCLLKRKNERQRFMDSHETECPEFVARSGRRRIRKTFLIREILDYHLIPNTRKRIIAQKNAPS